MKDETYDQKLGGEDRIETRKRGVWLLKNPSTNKGLAYTLEERRALGLDGLLPHQVLEIGQQVELELEHIRAKATDLEKYIGLTSLQDLNEVLFYRVLVENLPELLPIVYTPTVGLACQKFSHILRSARGIWITPGQHRSRARDPGERAVPRHPAAGGHRQRAHPRSRRSRRRRHGHSRSGSSRSTWPARASILRSVLPVSLDVGTNNQALLDDPLYNGYRRRRLTGEAYFAFVEKFVQGVRDVFPRAVIQWEDFAKTHSFTLLERYRKRVPSFNDDIQGTAAVTLGGIFAALRITRQSIREQRVLFIGAGGACIGIARLTKAAMRAGRSRRRRGPPRDRRLRFPRAAARRPRDPGALQARVRAERAEPRRTTASMRARIRRPSTMIRAFRPTILVGATAQANAFTREMLEEMATPRGAAGDPAALEPHLEVGVHAEGCARLDRRARHRGDRAARSRTSCGRTSGT